METNHSFAVMPHHHIGVPGHQSEYRGLGYWRILLGLAKANCLCYCEMC